MTAPAPADLAGVRVGRYLLHQPIAQGGMATIHLARLTGDEGFTRIVAAKRLRPEYAHDAEFVTMFLDEARVASKIHHANVVPVLDVISAGGEVILVQEYVHGVALDKLCQLARARGVTVPVPIAVAIATQVLAGLGAAHATTDELGAPLAVIHRDVSPHNIMIASDGTARLLDFGIAKASVAAHVTRENSFKGKIAYSAPEQLQGGATQASDLFAFGVVLWELLAGVRMHQGASGEREIVGRIMSGTLPRLAVATAQADPSRRAAVLALASVVERSLAVEPADRWPDAAAMARALTDRVTPASSTDVAAWLRDLGRELLEQREQRLAADEVSWRRTLTPTRARRVSEPDVEITRDPGPAARARRTRRAALAAAAVAIASGAAIAWLWPRPSPQRAAPSAPLTAPATTAPPVTTAPAAPAPATAAPPVDTRTAPPASTAVAGAPPAVEPASATQPAPSTAATGHRRRGPRAATTAPLPAPTSAPAAPAAVPVDACDPPYTFEGTKKVFKPSCL
ncbi:MAG: serine/threonine protein kinase [Myxococcales bacterium]|nr:serine/threonine protein kinase [Myxococcales bacterium]MBP6844908.1 serine/threonine protein kinase [Kofleriaceae bacterium]